MCSNRPSRVFRVNRLGYSHSSAPVFLGIELTFTGVMPSPPIEASLVAQMVKNLPAVLQETQVLSMGQEDPLEKGMTNHSSILAWSIPRTVQMSQSQTRLSNSVSLSSPPPKWG